MLEPSYPYGTIKMWENKDGTLEPIEACPIETGACVGCLFEDGGCYQAPACGYLIWKEAVC